MSELNGERVKNHEFRGSFFFVYYLKSRNKLLDRMSERERIVS